MILAQDEHNCAADSVKLMEQAQKYEQWAIDLLDQLPEGVAHLCMLLIRRSPHGGQALWPASALESAATEDGLRSVPCKQVGSLTQYPCLMYPMRLKLCMFDAGPIIFSHDPSLLAQSLLLCLYKPYHDFHLFTLILTLTLALNLILITGRCAQAFGESDRTLLQRQLP